MRCAKCARDNPDDAKFCVGCGNPCADRCAKCGAENPADASFCKQCGTRLGGIPAPSATAARSNRVSVGAEQSDVAALEGERKTVTALFADIKGSMELIEDLDPEEARAIVEPALRLMMEAVQHYGGYVAQSTGDGIFALFGAPIAYEDHPQRALYAALRMQEELKRYSDRIRAEGRLPVQARVGVNTGEVVVRSIATGEGRSEYVPVGHSTGIAARMEALAPVGSIAATEALRKLCEGYFVFRSLGPTKVKGVSEPVKVYEVTGLGPLRTRLQRGAARGYTKFVGRQRDMETLKHAAELAQAGHGQLVAAVAEHGVGKSRLFFEFKAKNQSGWKVLEAFSVSHGKASAYLPLIDLLHGYFGITAEDDARQRRQKLLGKLLDLDRSLEEAVPCLFALLGIVEGEDPLARMDAQVKKRRILEAIKRILVRESLNQPLIVVFEDLHWIDEQTHEFLNLLADSLANAKILLLVNYRPEYSHRWGSKTYYTQLRLDPLGTESADEMLSALLGDSPDIAPVKKLIIERTEGNPFFMEEMYQAMLEDAVIAGNGAVKLAKPLQSARIPTTVQGVLAARIDRLPADAKQLLQTLSVVGRVFPMPLIRALLNRSNDELARMLNDLQLGEFIYEQPALGDIEFTFKHALTQEVAYNSVLVERRKVLHERTAQALEALFVDSVDEHLVELSYHYSRSGNDSRAIDYLIRAAEQSRQRSAHPQAVVYFQDALNRLDGQLASPERDRKEIAIHTGLGDAATVMHGYAAPEFEYHLTRCHELAQRLGDTTQIFYSLVSMSVLAAFRLQLTKARDLSWKLLDMADHEHDLKMQLYAHSTLANVLWLLGDFIGSSEHAVKGLTLFADKQILPSLAEHHRAACQYHTCVCAMALGFPEKSLRQALEFLAWARQRAESLPLTIALYAVATILAWRGEGEKALEYADAQVAVASEHGFSNWYSFGQIVRGRALALSGKADEAIRVTKTGIDSLAATGAAVSGWAYASLALSYLAAERPEEGLKIAVKGLETADHANEAYLYEMYGELLLMSSTAKVSDAEESFRSAIATASKQWAKFAELSATTKLARLLAKQGSRDEARTILAEIYNWFTEGFDTADLKDAKALLDELSA